LIIVSEKCLKTVLGNQVILALLKGWGEEVQKTLVNSVILY